MKFYIFLLFLNIHCVFSQNVSIQNVLDLVGKKEYCINKKIKLSGNILTSQIGSKNYFLKLSNERIILYHLLTKDDLYVFYMMDNEMFKKTKEKYKNDGIVSNVFGINNDLLIYNKKTEEFLYLVNFNVGRYSYSSKGVVFSLFFDLSSPIFIRDRNFESKYCFFNTSDDSDNNLAFYEIINHEKYSQVNIYGQNKLKNINVLDLDINEIKNICTYDTKLIRKEYYELFDIRILNIYRQILSNNLKKYTFN